MPLDLVALKKTFFDSQVVIDTLRPEVRKALSKFGAFVRTRSRTSIKKAPKAAKGKKAKGKKPKQRTSRPGQPPLAHNGDIRRILFGYDAANKSVVIGPIIYGARSGAPQTLEEGGFARLKTGKRVKVAPRPFMKPAFETELKAVGNNFKNLIK